MTSSAYCSCLYSSILGEGLISVLCPHLLPTYKPVQSVASCHLDCEGVARESEFLEECNENTEGLTHCITDHMQFCEENVLPKQQARISQNIEILLNMKTTTRRKEHLCPETQRPWGQSRRRWRGSWGGPRQLQREALEQTSSGQCQWGVEGDEGDDRAKFIWSSCGQEPGPCHWAQPGEWRGWSSLLCPPPSTAGQCRRRHSQPTANQPQPTTANPEDTEEVQSDMYFLQRLRSFNGATDCWPLLTSEVYSILYYVHISTH